MSWEARGGQRYYFRALRRGGRTVKEYYGTGPAAELAARQDARARRERGRPVALLGAERERAAPAERAAAEFEAACELATWALMLAAGFHRHRSGPWRRRRHGSGDVDV